MDNDYYVFLLREAAAILRSDTDQRRRNEFSCVIDNFLVDHDAAQRLRRDPLMKLLEACDVSDDCQYGTLATQFVRDLVREAIGPKCERCGDTGWIQGDPVIGISDEPCGCDDARVPVPPKCDCAEPVFRHRGYAVYCDYCDRDITADKSGEAG